MLTTSLIVLFVLWISFEIGAEVYDYKQGTSPFNYIKK